MKIKRRLIWICLLTFATLNMSSCANDYQRQRKKDLLHVTVKITDESGQPIPYVTVWGDHSPRHYNLALAQADLWRITQRYHSSFEFATRYNPIVSSDHVRIMGNQEGLFKEDFDYQGENGYPHKRLDTIELTYVFMKRGYLPTLITIPVAREPSISATVTLKRDPKTEVEKQIYVQRFEAIRYDLSDTSKDENISTGTHNRNFLLRQELGNLANEAIKAHDNKVAARIYMRMVFLPHINFYNGKPSGWSHQEPGSSESIEYLNRAAKLDTENPYISLSALRVNSPLSKYEDKTGIIKFNPFKADQADRELVDVFIKEYQSLLEKYGEQVWPNLYLGYINSVSFHSDIKEQDKIPQLLDELYKFEPKYESLEFIQSLKKRYKEKQEHLQYPECFLKKDCPSKKN